MEKWCLHCIIRCSAYILCSGRCGVFERQSIISLRDPPLVFISIKANSSRCIVPSAVMYSALIYSYISFHFTVSISYRRSPVESGQRSRIYKVSFPECSIHQGLDYLQTSGPPASGRHRVVPSRSSHTFPFSLQSSCHSSVHSEAVQEQKGRNGRTSSMTPHRSRGLASD